MSDETDDEGLPELKGVSTLPEGGEPEQQPEVAAEETQEAPASWWSRFGDEYASLTEDQAVERLSRARQAEQRVSQLEQESARNQFALWQAQQQAQAQQQKPAEEKPPVKAKRDVPPYDPAWVNLVKRNEAGEWVSIPGAQPDLPQKIQAYAAFREAEQQKFLTDPAAYLQEVAGDQIRQMAYEVMANQWQSMQQQADQQRQQQQIIEFEQRNAALLYEDPQTRMRPSAIGLECARRQQNYLNLGIRDRAQALEMAMRDMYAEAQAEEYKRTRTNGANGNGKSPQEQFLRDTAAKAIKRQPNRDGGKAAGELPKGKLNYGEMFKRNLEAAGIPSK